MGKIAAAKLCCSLGNIIAFITALITISAAIFAGYDPRACDSFFLMEIILPVLLVVNLLLGIYYLIRKNPITIIFFIAIIANYNLIGSIYQNPFKAKVEQNAKNRIKVMTFNAEGFLFSEDHKMADSFKAFIEKEKIDVICIQEYSDNETSNVLGCFDSYPYSYIGGKDTNHMNTAIYSKHPISDSCVILFNNSRNSTLSANIFIHNRLIRLFCNHLQTTNLNHSLKKISLPHIGYNCRLLKKILDELKINNKMRADQADIIDSLKELSDLPTIVCSDMNDVPLSYTYQQVKGKYKDSFIEQGRGFGYSYHGFLSLFRIDYIFYSSQFTNIDYLSPSTDWSDHNPVIATLVLN